MTTGETTYGLLRIGDARVALPLAALREVIPCPQAFAPVPAQAPGLRGAVNLRDVVIPVVDLAAAMRWPTTDGGGQVVVIVSSHGRMLGVIADRVDGITTVGDQHRHDTRDATGNLIFTHTFAHPETGAVVSILDADAILGLPGVPAVADPTDHSVTARPTGRASAGRPVLLVRCGEFRIAISLPDIHAVLPRLEVVDSPLTGDLCRGVTDYMNNLVPVVDLSQALGLGASTDPAAAQGLLWHYPEGLLALQVDEVVEIVTLDDAQIHALPPLGASGTYRFRGVARIPEHGQYLVADPAAISADETLHGLGRLNTSGATPIAVAATAEKGGRPVSRERYLTYRAGVEVATPLHQITEIITYPTEVAPLTGAGAGLVGVFTHRDCVVSLVRLNEVIGRAPGTDPSASRVLLVEWDGNHVGYVVDALGAIEDPVWEQEADGPPARPGRLEDSPLLEFGVESESRLLPKLDLAAWAAART